MSGYIYILREREFIRTNDSIWKIGATKHDDVFKRVKQYPNNSQLMYCLRVTDAFNVEKEIMTSLKNHPGIIQRTDIGREYFEGKLQKIASLVLSISVIYLEDVLNDSDDIFRSKDPVSAWINTLEIRKDVVVSHRDAIDAFHKWYDVQEDVGKIIIDDSQFKKSMESAGFKHKKHEFNRHSPNRVTQRGYRGLMMDKQILQTENATTTITI
jgi:hypothetical protein